MPSIAAPIRHFSLVFAAETKRLVAYRVQFWCELVLSSIIELFVTIMVWRAVFEANGGGPIHGYTYPMMVLYATVAVFFAQAIRGTNVGTFARDIYDGSLTKYLIYPLSIYSYKFGTFFPRAPFAIAQLILAIVAISLIGLWPADFSLQLGSIVLSLIAVVLGCLVYFLLLFCIESLAFWADQVWALSVMLQACVLLLSGRLIPIDLFPPWLGSIVSWLPFPYLAFFQVKIFLGQTTGLELLHGFVVLIAWIALGFAASGALYRLGLRKYTGVGM